MSPDLCHLTCHMIDHMTCQIIDHLISHMTDHMMCHMTSLVISWKVMEGYGRFWYIPHDSHCSMYSLFKVYIRAVVWPPVAQENYPHLVTLTL